MNDNIIILNKKICKFQTMYDKFYRENNIDDIELKEILCDILSWFEICIKKIDNLNDIEKEKISAIKYANNMKKHSVSIYNYTLNTLALYPADDLYPSDDLFPSDFTICWNNLPLDSKQYIKQYNNYNKHLNGNDVNITIYDIYKIIKEHYIE